ncbi:biopolymer transporter ExbD [Acidobacteria bacterium AH-259-D05]|nr:biopolymer transporter ExbD [Acidobacteria bacterium AH-259-D05]
MKKRHQIRRIAPVIPTASMADIAFLLIIFFMLTTSFSPERTTVQLPQSEIRTEVARDAAIIAITEEGTLRFTDGERLAFLLGSPEEIGPLTREIVEFIPDKEFLIKADRLVRYELIDAVLDQLRMNGARRIGLLTEREIRRIA